MTAPAIAYTTLAHLRTSTRSKIADVSVAARVAAGGSAISRLADGNPEPWTDWGATISPTT
jgi:hypothetical protein